MIDISDHGIFGDGITDFTVEINDLLEQNSGQEIYFPPGVYPINADIDGVRPKSGTTLLLDPATILKAKPSSIKNYSVIICYQVEDVSLLGGLILGERTQHLNQEDGFYGAGIKIWKAKNTTIRDMALSRFWGDGIFVGSSGPAGEITGPTTIENVLSYGNIRAGLVATYISGLTIRNSRFFGNYGTRGYSAGIFIEPDDIDGISADDIIIDGVECAHNETYGAVITGYHKPINGLRINELHSHHNGRYGLCLSNDINELKLGKLDVHDNTEGDIFLEKLTSKFCTVEG